VPKARFAEAGEPTTMQKERVDVKLHSLFAKIAPSALVALALTTGGVAAAAQDAAPGSGSWTVPSCQKIVGTAGVTYTTDDGATLAPTTRTLQGTSYTLGLVALDTPNTLLAAVGSQILRSTDAGCRFSLVADLSTPSGGALLTLTAAPNGRAYAWADNGSALFRIDGTTVTTLQAPVTSIVGFAVDPANGDHVRLGDSNGVLWESTTGGVGGRSWSAIGTPPVAGAFVYRAAFDPRNLDHVLLGTISTGAFVTTDGGRSWTQSTGLASVAGGSVNAFNAVVSSADPQVVWVQGLDITESDANAPSQGRHIWRSVDGGLTFTTAVSQSSTVTLTNGAYLSAHPTASALLYFTFGTSFGNYGSDLFRYDAATGALTVQHNNLYHGIKAIAYSPASAAVLYLGVAHEQIQ
jgi:hypothetical protein